MTYEVDGTAIGVGDATYQGREVHRLEYRTGKDWVDTVIAAPSVDTVAGPVSAFGSYQRLRAYPNNPAALRAVRAQAK